MHSLIEDGNTPLGEKPSKDIFMTETIDIFNNASTLKDYRESII